jgi:hypothetical protein
MSAGRADFGEFKKHELATDEHRFLGTKMIANFRSFKENMYLRISAKICVLLVLSGLFACQQVQKPELKGEGPLAVTLARGTATPEYHAPAERWRVNHGQALNRGDFSRRECVLCHNPETGCNQCHQYVGAGKILVPEASLYWGHEKK